MVQLKSQPPSLKLFVSFFLILSAINYLFLLAEIRIDTGMNIAKIAEGYRSLDLIEYIEHAFEYLAWFIFTFALALGVFLFSSYRESLKRFFCILVPLAIVSDMSSMWFVRYSDWFAAQMFISGFTLALCFFSLFWLIQYELWLKK